jgi:hypothetical protein
MPLSSNFGCCFDIWLHFDNIKQVNNKPEDALMWLGLELNGGINQTVVTISTRDDRNIEYIEL